MINIFMKKQSTSLAVKEMQIKVSLIFHLSLVRIAIINNTNKNKCWQSCGEKKEHLYTVGGNVH
jgi:hypothetical protein